MFNECSLTLLCQTRDLSRSGYYNWGKCTKPNKDAKDAQDEADFKLIPEAYTYRNKSKEARIIYWWLLDKKSVIMNV